MDEVIKNCMQEIKQHQNFLDDKMGDLKCKLNELEELQNNFRTEIEQNSTKRANNMETKEISNYYKKLIEEHIEPYKIKLCKLFAAIKKVQHMVTKLSEYENPIKKLLTENNDTFAKINTDMEMKRQHSHYLITNYVEKMGKENSQLLAQITEIHPKIEAINQEWNQLEAQFKKKVELKKTIIEEMQLLENSIEDKQTEDQNFIKLLVEKDNEIQKCIESLKTEFQSEKDKQLELEVDTRNILDKIKDCSKTNEEFELKIDETKTRIAEKNKQHIILSQQFIKHKENFDERHNDLQLHIAFQRELLQEADCKNLEYRAINKDLLEKKQDLLTKYQAQEEKIGRMQQKFEKMQADNQECTHNIGELDYKKTELANQKIELKNESLSLRAALNEKNGLLEKLLQQSEDYNTKTTHEFESITKSRNSEIETMEEEIKQEEVHIKELQTKTEQLNIDIVDIERKALKTQNKNAENEGVVKQLDCQINSTLMDIKKTELANLEKKKVVPTPPLLKRPASKVPSAAPLPKSRQLAKKKKNFMDTSSDSSVDGERLTYAEFMKRKRAREVQKQHKNAQLSKK